MQAPIPSDEQQRLRAVNDCNLLDTPPERAYDRIARLASQLFSVPIAAVSLIGEDRQFFKSIVGLNIRETHRDIAFCSHAILSRDPLVVLDARKDPRFSDNPMVTGEPGIRFYCGAPMETAHGLRIGTVCVIDTKPRQELAEESLKLLTELAAQTMSEISHRQREIHLAKTATVLFERERELERERHLRQESEIRTDLALEAGRMGSWDWDATSGRFSASLLMQQLFGLGEKEVPTWRNWFQRVHPEDRTSTINLLRHAARTLESFEPEFRVSYKGKVRWVAVKGRTFRTNDGKLQGAKGVCWDVTDRRLSEERLRESEEIFRGISVSCPAGIFQADLNGHVSYANPRVQEIWAMKQEELRGLGWITRLHPEDANALLDTWLAANRAGREFEREYRLLMPDQSVRWVHGRATVIRDRTGAPIATVGTVDDITERKRLEHEQHTNQELTRRILDSSADCIKVLDLEGRLQLMSPGGIRALGITDLPALLGKKYFELWKEPKDRTAAEEGFQMALAGGTGSFQGYFPGINGEMRWWDTAFNPIVGQTGMPERILAVSRDMTELRRASEEQERARRLAEEANQAKSLFLANVSHELRTPLNGVLATTEVLMSSPLDNEQQELAQTIRHSGEALLRLVDDLLDLGRMEAGKLSCRSEAFDLKRTIDQAVALVAKTAFERGLTLSVKYLNPIPELLLGDEARLRQILINYLNNALKFTERGSISIQVRAEKLQGGGKQLQIAVRDTGSGISEEAQVDLFKPFKQVDGSTTRKHGGLGLGLAISARLAEAMGGSVGLKSAVGRGSTFWVRLPLLVAEQPIESVAAPVKFEPVQLEHLQVLVAEDNVINQKVTLQLLAKLGCDSDLAPNGEVAVQMFRQKRYDLVLMDCQMPEVDGYEAARQIRGMEQSDALNRTPIVALTAHGMAGDKERSLASGMDDHLVKPLSLMALRNALEKWRTVAALQ